MWSPGPRSYRLVMLLAVALQAAIVSVLQVEASGFCAYVTTKSRGLLRMHERERDRGWLGGNWCYLGTFPGELPI